MLQIPKIQARARRAPAGPWRQTRYEAADSLRGPCAGGRGVWHAQQQLTPGEGRRGGQGPGPGAAAAAAAGRHSKRGEVGGKKNAPTPRVFSRVVPSRIPNQS